MSATYNELLAMANEQQQPQRLLFLFAKPEGNNPKKSKKMQRGHLQPIMCVDKLPEEVQKFESLVAEADSVAQDWQFIFIAALSGTDGTAPDTEQAEPYLNKMTNDLVTGNNIANYVVLDRAGKPIEMMVN
ncbi:ribonucleotide reductase subunit alpha [Thalassotalea litorea]|uniref:Ribonucleotide reductase subunit alpha n=1 Tax=Thalassotalea litorea TaxID=2020715 RepID=A0A5R9IL22_9GAMM|nr:ribonucleotide reductase subunit alpha [Thalassotalea litorea]TLU61997.1 ribonucleotide reductase subunit alpha [Thalassotalea litorea]